MSYNPDLKGLTNIAPRATQTVSTVARLDSGAKRGAVKIANGGAVDLFVKFVQVTPTMSAPTITANDFHDVVSAGDASPWWGLSESVAVYGYCASSNTAINVVEGSY